MYGLLSVEEDSASSTILLLWSSCYHGVFVHRGETVQPGARPSPAFWPLATILNGNRGYKTSMKKAFQGTVMCEIQEGRKRIKGEMRD